MDIQCAATVKSTGHRCSYKGKFVDAKTKKHYCGHHYQNNRVDNQPILKPKLTPPPLPAKSEPVAVVVVDQTPWKTRGLPEPSGELRLSVKRRLRNRINRGPKSNDSTGHLYVYSLASEQGNNYWKVGMTTRSDLQDRLKEWKSKHPHDTVVLKHSYQVDVKAVRCLERVVHLYLDHKRMYRYPVMGGKHLVSIWSATREEIDDGGRRAWSKKEKLSAAGKMVEWFCLPWETELKPLLDALVKYYCASL